nr:MAG TPA: hypothetical protein [Caudoviricetes sp.]
MVAWLARLLGITGIRTSITGAIAESLGTVGSLGGCASTPTVWCGLCIMGIYRKASW